MSRRREDEQNLDLRKPDEIDKTLCATLNVFERKEIIMGLNTTMTF
jgi:hypothetical protein